MADCLTVFCLNWTGDGCACQVFGIDPVEVEHDPGCACRKCEATHAKGRLPTREGGPQ